ncbi:MAG: DUF1015 domain-containing protein [Ruminococcaceae bacterium]|nr:DUF1015 domain-containing protein [Oscillospiraceae bacterium]
MAIFKPFKALRPTTEYASKVAALPYDVMNSEEAREMVKGNPYSFLHIDKAEIDLEKGIDLYSDEVYEKAKENLEKLEKDGVMKQDEKKSFYIYRQIMNGKEQTGLVGCASIDDYINNEIKKHELTRADKEADRIRHVDTCDANTGPIFLCYKECAEVDEIIAEFKKNNEPVYDFVTEDGVSNTVWVIGDEIINNELSSLLSKAGAFYIADGHHRCASAVNVGKKRREENPDFDGTEEFNFFLAVLFPANTLSIMDYNRVVKDLNGNTESEFIEKIKNKFEVSESNRQEPYSPQEKHTFGMYLNNKWYVLKALPGTFNENDPVERLDVSILQNNLLSPILAIGDPRTDKRIDFIGGIRGLKELERRVSNDMTVAFSMYPTTLDDLMDIADANKIMPPKSTWFEPKLLSGLFIHKLGD